MGIEYRLHCNASAAAIADVLRRHPAAQETSSVDFHFELGKTSDGWPQATAHAEADGAYFCDHCGGEGRAIMGEVVARLVSAFGAVTVKEL